MPERTTPAQTMHQRRLSALDRVKNLGRRIDGAASDRTIAVLKGQGRVDDANRVVPTRPETNRSHGERQRRSGRPRLGSVALAAVITAGGGAVILQEGGAEGDTTPPAAVTVAGEGDTIWSLMRAEANSHDIDPDADIREWVDQAVEMNGGTDVQPGQRVLLPVIDAPQPPAAP